jgi:hypothetical protein
MPPRPRASAAAAVLLAAALAAAAAGTFDYVRVFEPPSRGSGTWSGKYLPNPNEGEIVGLAVAADWWNGPGDARAGDAKKAAMPGIAYEVRRGEGAWVPLPPADRDLRLTARTAAPADAEGLYGGAGEGEWSVRQVKGGAYPHRLRIEFTCRGDPLLVKDLAVRSLMLPGLDPKPVVGHEYIPDRTENPTLKSGAGVHAVVVVANCGARKVRETDLDLLAVPFGRRQGKRMGFAQVPALEPGAAVELRIDGTIPEDLAVESGLWEVLAYVNPRSSEREVETFNNALGRAFRYEVPEKKEALPSDLRDR